MGVEIGYKLVVTVKDKNGKVVEKRKVKGNSFVSNFIKALYGLMYEDACSDVIELTDIYGNSKWYPALDYQTYPIFRVTAQEGEDKYGILYGTGTTPFSVDDYKLESPIPHGDADNQLHYYSTDLLAVEIKDNRVQYGIQRPAVNNGSVAINVTEIGLIAFDVTHYDELWFLIIRDVLDTAITVNPNQTITATYTIYTTF